MAKIVDIEALAKRVGGKATAKAVYGKAVEREGVTVIPVARAAWGFGGGGGTSDGEQGTGGGGGGFVRPVGFIEVRDGQAKFRAIRDPRVALRAAVIVLVALAVALRARGRG